MKIEEKRNIRLNMALEIISTKEGVCLDKTYNKCKDKILVQCKNKHTPWRVDPYRILKGDWCRKCYFEKNAEETRVATYKKLLKYLNSINSTVVEPSYDYRNQKLHYKCAICGKFWTMEPTRLLEGKLTCTECKKIKNQQGIEKRRIEKEEIKRITAEERQRAKELQKQLANLRKQNEYELLRIKNEERRKINQYKKEQLCYSKASDYLKQFGCIILKKADSFRFIEWECPNGHTWKDEPRNFVALHEKHSWCKICNRKIAIEKAHATRLANDLEFARNWATQNKGICLTNEIEKAADGFDFVCNRGHKFNLTYQKIHSGHQWCPKCQATISSTGETISREVIEQLTGLKFPLDKKVEGLISPTSKKQLSLDMYNRDKKLAFEYHGKNVHYDFRENGRYSDKEHFERTKEIDEEKKNLCKKLGIKLIIIKGFESYISDEKIIERIKFILTENSIPFNENTKIDLTKISYKIENITELVKKYCMNHDGTLESPVVTGMLKNILVHCNKHNYTWETRASSLLNQRKWCNKCAKEKVSKALLSTPNKIQEKLDMISRPFKITFLSKEGEYEGVHSYGDFTCEKHGKFSRRIDTLIYPSRQDRSQYLGCPKCDEELHPSNYRRLGKRK